MRIKKVKITNFKCFEDTFELVLNDSINILVGNNEAGKSTIIEAINMDVTGLYRGKYLKNELSESLFNISAVNKYIKAVNGGKSSLTILPKIVIEIYTEGIPTFLGDCNSDTDRDAEGFVLEILFDEAYKVEYEELIKSEVKSLPIEYYTLNWKAFARDTMVLPKNIPLKCAVIDSTTYNSNFIDVNLAKILTNLLNDNEKIKVAQAHRCINDNFNSQQAIKDFNAKIEEAIKITTKKITLGIESISRNSWETSISTFLDEIPFQNLGMGEQSIIKTEIALNSKKSIKSNIILIEEPENHLSFSKLNKLINEIINNCTDKQIIITTHNSFVANKLGLNNLILLNDHKNAKLTELSEDTYKYFKKIAGYDTLRFLLCKKAILVEGDSDELIVQRAYKDKFGKLPIEDEIDVISVGMAFLRYLEIAIKLNKEVVVITDNDGSIISLNEKYKEYIGKDKITISFDQAIDTGHLMIGDKQFNYNTLEPKLVRDNSKEIFEEIFNKTFSTIDELHIYMQKNKTECAILIFEHVKSINYPDYIKGAI